MNVCITELAQTEAADLTYYAVSIVGPRNRVDKLVGTVPLLGGSLGVRR